MQQFEIVTPQGKMTVQITVTSDKVFDNFGLEAAKVETALCNIIGEKLLGIGGSTTRPVKWDN